MKSDLTAELITALTDEYPQTRRIIIAFSGGIDSRVLLRLACLSRQQHKLPIVAIHVDHALQEASKGWAEQCQRLCDQEGIELILCKATIDATKGESLEALARTARYALFESQLRDGDILLLAQHADDQAETVLLQLLRGAGIEGLSAMPKVRPLGCALMIRPLLAQSRVAIENYAVMHKLKWIEDPSNKDTRFDRNYLRQNIMPQLYERFPAAAVTFSRSAKHCADATSLLDELLDITDFIDNENPEYLNLINFQPLTSQQEDYLLRAWIRKNGYRAPQKQQLIEISKAFLAKETSSTAEVSTREYVLRKYQNRLTIGKKDDVIQTFHYHWKPSDGSLKIAELGLEISMQSLLELGICLPEDKLLSVRSREGGEKIGQGSPVFHKSLKKLFQEKNIPPWLRDRYYLILLSKQLIAVPGLAVDPRYTFGNTCR